MEDQLVQSWGMQMFCVNCGTKLEDAWSHCAKCGRARGTLEGKIPDINPYKSSSEKPKFKLGCLSIIFIVIAVGTITSAFSGGGDGGDPASQPTLTSSKQTISLADAAELTGEGTLAEFAATKCDAIPTSGIGELGASLARFNEKASDVSEPRKALAFISKQTGAGESLREFNRELQSALGEMVGEIVGRLDSSKYEVDPDSGNDDLEAALIENCPQLSALKSLRERSQEFERQTNRLNALADSVPWYPDGYETFGIDSRFAYQNVGGYCELGDSCARFKIVGNVSCNDLYIEVNFLDSSGVVVDWGNELLTLPAYQTALVDIATFSDISQWQLTELTCR